VQAHVYAAPDSVVRSYLRDGIDGWRLDVAFDIGFTVLGELTKAAHAEKPGSLIVGEIANYPKEWFPSVDGVMHFTMRHLLLRTADRRLPAPTAQRMLTRLIGDANYEHILKSWIYLDNHDTFRLATTLPDPKARRIAQVLQFTLPGSPNLYYGSEVAMEGGDDPEMRAPMRWDLVEQKHPDLAWTRQLTAMRKAQRSLRIGDFRSFEAQNLIAFQRHTDRAADAVYVFINPSLQEVSETVLITDSKTMDGTLLKDLLGGPDERVMSSLIELKLPPQSFRVLRPVIGTPEGYNNYKRVQ
jgi:cyclomaltodextrinase / maltogenic alpha-amylase / neopullulanase